jgi:hypothetical protein
MNKLRMIFGMKCTFIYFYSYHLYRDGKIVKYGHGSVECDSGCNLLGSILADIGQPTSNQRNVHVLGITKLN